MSTNTQPSFDNNCVLALCTPFSLQCNLEIPPLILSDPLLNRW
jgi:hypothetical protein